MKKNKLGIVLVKLILDMKKHIKLASSIPDVINIVMDTVLNKMIILNVQVVGKLMMTHIMVIN